MKKLTILRGLSGSGKSTVARQLAQAAELRGLSWRICSADEYFEEPDGVYKFDPSKLPNAHAYSRGACDHAMVNGFNHIIVDNTNVQVWEYKPYLQMAKDHGYEVEVITIGDTTQASCAEYARRNVHGLTLDNLLKQASRWEK